VITYKRVLGERQIVTKVSETEVSQGQFQIFDR